MSVSHAPHGSSVLESHFIPSACMSVSPWLHLPPFLLRPDLPRFLPLLCPHDPEQHTDLDNLNTVQHNLRNSAKGSNDAYDVTVSLTCPEPKESRLIGCLTESIMSPKSKSNKLTPAMSGIIFSVCSASWVFRCSLASISVQVTIRKPFWRGRCRKRNLEKRNVWWRSRNHWWVQYRRHCQSVSNSTGFEFISPCDTQSIKSEFGLCRNGKTRCEKSEWKHLIDFLNAGFGCNHDHQYGETRSGNDK